MSADRSVPTLDRPLVILSSPRSGSTLLFELLAGLPGCWTIAGESHPAIESVPELTASRRGYVSNKLTAADLTPGRRTRILREFGARLVDRDGHAWTTLDPAARARPLRLIEKTPRNILRVGFLEALFRQQARYVLLYREPRETLASMIEAWEAPGFWQFKQDVEWCELPGWERNEWCMLLPPGWQDLNGCSLAEIVAFQWRVGYEDALHGLRQVHPGRWTVLSYRDLVERPDPTLDRIMTFAGLATDAGRPASVLPHSSSIVTAPRPGKWRDREDEVLGVVDEVAAVHSHLIAADRRTRSR